jgi:glutamate N-acetyltransferase/amino-acid N-acetyltransferase
VLPATRFAPLPDYVQQVERSVTYPRGYHASGIAAGIKRSGRRDVGILSSDVPCVSAAMFTSNAACAAPVLLTRETGACDRLRAVIVNSGNANACTGKHGLGDAARMRTLTANLVRVPVEQVAVASTGVIGVPLPMEKVEAGIVKAAARLSPSGGEDFALAIRTTDKTVKHGALSLTLDAGEVRVGLAAKGCGMISPNMATMLCFVTTDAIVAAAAWQELLAAAVHDSFNRITVDGQESTNDMVLGFANGAAGVRLDADDLARLGEALRAALVSLAVAMVADGEGSTKTMKLRVTGARDQAQAEAVARAVANSPLVKTAFYGRDANWGRIVQAVGQALGRDHHGPVAADVVYDDVAVVKRGAEVGLNESEKARIKTIMNEPEIDLHVGLNGAGAGATIYFSDLTHDYVTLNAEYTT